MEELSWFWAGASTLPVGDVVLALLDAGVSVESLTADDLVAAGATHEQARTWRNAAPSRTQGAAVTLADPRYPERLRLLRGPPPVLFVEGDPLVLSSRSIGIVGTRTCTAYGRAVARHLGHASASAGLVVVSGLARGIDAEAHQATLGIGCTIAVLAHGLGHTAPRYHARLRQRIVAEGGALLTTHPDDVEPRPFLFPRRNRWIAALSEVVVVVEAGATSGALITAREALAEGRDVAAVPGPLGAPASEGCLKLLADGAAIVDDVERFVATLAGGAARAHDAWLGDVFSGIALEQVARRHGRSAADILVELTRLELEGSVVRRPGQRYAPAGRMS